MHRSVETSVRLKAIVTIVAMVIVGVAGTSGAQAASPVVSIRLDASLQKRHGSVLPASILNVATRFSTDTPGVQPFTVRKAVLYFPDRGTEGRPFPSCSAQQIARFHGNVRRCPKGSKIGHGTVKALAIQLGIAATGRVTLFNGPRGRSITFNIRTTRPAYINRSFDARIAIMRRGRYREKLTLEVPPSLQEILSGVFVAVRELDVTIDGAVRVHGVQHNYVRARRCPRWAMRGTFDLLDSATGQQASVTSDGRLRCRVR